jgi:phosphoribosylanthranilate isomerase
MLELKYMNIKIKICGITQLEDAKAAISMGVDALGFIFYPKSSRYISPSLAKDIIRKLPPFVSKVGVFVNETLEKIQNVISHTGIDTVQLHGNETPEFTKKINVCVIKAFGIKEDFDLNILKKYEANAYLLDTWSETHGGSGKTFNWEIAKKAISVFSNIILAGGLNPTNISELLSNVIPYAVEFNSGVEIKPGIKNHHKMLEAIKIVREWKKI